MMKDYKMVSVVFEKFLPTDTVVDVPEILSSSLEYPRASVIVGLFAVFALLFMFGASQSLQKKVSRVWAGSVIAVMAVLAVVTLMIVPVQEYNADREQRDKEQRVYKQLVEEADTKNRDNLSANIMSVYDVDRVELKKPSRGPEWDYITGTYMMDKTVMPSKTSSVNAVVFQDGRTYDVLVSQDPDTYEPLLSVSPLDTPIRKK